MMQTVQRGQKVAQAWLLLKLTYGIVPIVAGLDKFFNVITEWVVYLNPQVVAIVPMSPGYIMYAVGAIEIVAGILVLTKWTRIGAYLVAAWLVVLALNILFMWDFIDVAVRDLVMAAGALALAWLTEALEE